MNEEREIRDGSFLLLLVYRYGVTSFGRPCHFYRHPILGPPLSIILKVAQENQILLSIVKYFRKLALDGCIFFSFSVVLKTPFCLVSSISGPLNLENDVQYVWCCRIGYIEDVKGIICKSTPPVGYFSAADSTARLQAIISSVIFNSFKL